MEPCSGRARLRRLRPQATRSGAMRTLALVITLLGLAVPVTTEQLPRASDLPDWSGAWARASGGFYESTPEQALQAAPPPTSPRRLPPYTPKFQAVYKD